MPDWIAPADVVPGLVGAGAMTGGAAKLCHHSTEGRSYAGARAAYASSGNGPHLTDTFENGRYQVRQHLPLSVAATALLHPDGSGQTNRDNVFQVEHVGFAAEAAQWDPEYLAGIAGLSRLLEAAAGCPSTAPLPFLPPGRAPRATWDRWHAVGGHYGHEHVPYNCVSADTPVLCADLVWRPAGDLLPGDELIAFQEEPDSQVGRRFQRATVTGNSLRRDALLCINTAAGTVRCNYEHPWLVRRKRLSTARCEWGRWMWVPARDLVAGDEVMYVVQPWRVERSWEAGWLAGMYDGEGSLSGGRNGFVLSCSQRESPTAEQMILAIKERADASVVRRSRLGPNRTAMVQVAIGRRDQMMRMLGMVRPPRLLAKADGVWENGNLGKTARRMVVDSIEPGGTGTIAALGTSSRTYIAAGFAMHNTHVDPGAMNVAAVLAGPPPGPAPAWVTLPADQEDDGIMRQIELDCGVYDGQGRGAVLFDGGAGTEPGITHDVIAIRWEDVRGVDLQGSFPPVDGYRGLSKVGRQQRDGFLCVQFDGGPPDGPVTVIVTVRT